MVIFYRNTFVFFPAAIVLRQNYQINLKVVLFLFMFSPDNPETVYKHTKLLFKLDQNKEAALNWLRFRGIQLHQHKGDLGAIKKVLRWDDETRQHILVLSPTDSLSRRGLETDA